MFCSLVWPEQRSLFFSGWAHAEWQVTTICQHWFAWGEGTEFCQMAILVWLMMVNECHATQEGRAGNQVHAKYKFCKAVMWRFLPSIVT